MISLNVLSLGAGVQSTTLALMACDGTLPGLDAAIFADTGWEPARVYRQLDRVAAHLAAAASIPHTASRRCPTLFAGVRGADAEIGGTRSSGAHRSIDLNTVAVFLPTPAAADGDRGPDFARAGRDGSGGDDLVTTVAKHASQWGKYADAIERWEAVTGPAPAPTKPNRKGNPRLNPAFSEWLMGWPTGWVTDVDGLTDSEALRIIGNGVVPQAAAAAITNLLNLSPSMEEARRG